MTTAPRPPTSAEMLLVEAFPALRHTLPWVSLSPWPTPITALPTLAAHLNIDHLWLKRDGHAGTLYGGNKVRKLEFVLAEALENDARAVWTIGAMGSHHALATAIYGRQLGLDVFVDHFPQPVTDHVRDTLRALISTGAHLNLVEHRAALPGILLNAHLRAHIPWHPKRAFVIPGGGSSTAGVLGYINAGLELGDHVARGETPEPDVIYVPAGTAGTLTGLWIGCHLAKLKSVVVGVRVIDRILCNRLTVYRLASQVAVWFRRRGLRIPAPPHHTLRMVHDQCGPGYGERTPAALAATALMERFGGPHLETTYTGKTLAAMMADARAGRLRDARVLFWNTINQRPLDDLINATPVADVPAVYRRFF